MQSYLTKPALAMLVALMPLLVGCENSADRRETGSPKNDARLIGAWRQERLSGKEVSDPVVNLFISERTLSMQAPGCRIEGEYTTAEDTIRFTLTSAAGENCDPGQKTGRSESARYRVGDSQLTLIQPSEGRTIETVFSRVRG